MELEILVHLVDVGENVLNDSRNDSTQIDVIHVSLQHKNVKTV